MAEIVRPAFSFAVLPVLFSALVVAGCAPSDPPRDQVDQVSPSAHDQTERPQATAAAAPTERIPEATDLEGAWLLEDLGGRGVIDMVQTTIEFDGNGGVFGSGGCNRYTGSYTLEDGRLTFGPLAGTKKMCPGAVMDQEDRFHRALGAVERIALEGPFLLIFVEATDQPLRFTRMSGEVED